MACDHALTLGVTGVHDAGLGSNEVRAYKSATEKGELKIRATLMLREEPSKTASLASNKDDGNNMLRIGPLKLLVDGSLGARTAALYEPYEDDPSTKGILLKTPDEIAELVKSAHNQNLQVAVHAIGDLAIEYAINAIQEALRGRPTKNHRHRIEHCEILSAQQIERLEQLRIVAAMQPNFVGEWSNPEGMYESRLGKRRLRVNNPYRALLDEGVIVCFGSDGMPFDPLYGIWSALNHPVRHSRITLEEAVRCYTLNSSYASFNENQVGSIEPGKLADITVFDKDLTKIQDETMRETKVYLTMVGGKILYKMKPQKTSIE
jgi:predicted amidohydrolase YtcJ